MYIFLQLLGAEQWRAVHALKANQRKTNSRKIKKKKLNATNLLFP